MTHDEYDNYKLDSLYDAKEDSSLIKQACDLWNKNIYNTKEISKIIKVSNSTVRNYLRKGNDIHLCNYPKIKN